MNVFYLTILAHIVADFLLQTDTMIRLKNGSRREARRGMLQHGAVVAAATLAAMLPYAHLFILVWAPAIAIVHLGIDNLKRWAEGRAGNPVAWFIIDQALHIISIFLLLFAAERSSPEVRQLLVEPPWGAQFHSTDLLLRLAVFGYVVFAGRYFIDLVMKHVVHLKPKVEEDHSFGWLIGMLERALVLLLLFYGELGSIGLIIAAKSLARFKQLDEKEFAEYYLLGTLLSLFLATLGFVLTLAV